MMSLNKLFAVLAASFFILFSFLSHAETAVPTGPTDIDHMEELASMSVSEALVSYQIFVEWVMNEEAANPANLQRLLKGTLDFTSVDPGNDHYYELAKVFIAYPAELNAAINAMPVDQEVKDEVRFTVESWAETLRHGNG